MKKVLTMAVLLAPLFFLSCARGDNAAQESGVEAGESAVTVYAPIEDVAVAEAAQTAAAEIEPEIETDVFERTWDLLQTAYPPYWEGIFDWGNPDHATGAAEWLDLDVDFIFVTNENDTVAPAVLREGGEFMGLTLQRLSDARISTRSGRYFSANARAEFSGEITARGDLTFRNFEHRLFPTNSFSISEEDIDKFPQLVYGGFFDGFTAENEEALLAMLGEDFYYVERSGVRTYFGITLRLSNFTLAPRSGGGRNTAAVTEVVSQSPEITHIAPSLHVHRPPVNFHSGASERFLQTFDTVHHFAYFQFEADRRGNRNLIFWPDTTVRDFSFMARTHVENSDDMTPWEVLFNIPEFSPSDILVLDVAFSHYRVPRGAVAFTDETGERRQMMIVENMSSIGPPIFLSTFARDD